MKASEVYRKAAEYIADRTYYYCCEAITFAGGYSRETLELKKYFNNYFQPTEQEFIKYNRQTPFTNIDYIAWFYGDHEQQERITALLLCAELAKEDESGKRLITSKK